MNTPAATRARRVAAEHGSEAQPGPTAELAGFVSSLELSSLPHATSEYSKKLLLDGIGCLIAGTGSEPGRSGGAPPHVFAQPGPPPPS